MDKMNKQQPAPETEAAEEAVQAEAAEAQEAEAVEPDNAMAEELAKANAKVEEYLAMAQRVQADFDNFRRRNESVRADAMDDGKRSVAALMLPVLDNLERAVAAAADAGESSENNALLSGVELTLRQLKDVFAKLEITEINRPGEPFDPNLENAVLQGTADDGEPGTVCQVLQKGYLMGKNVLRHAMVKVVPED